MNQKKVILIVDDEKIVLNSLQAMLTRNLGREFELEFAESAEEAFEIIEDIESSNMKLYAIITDWLMPQMKGDEFLSRVQASRSGIRTIMLSGQADQESIRLAFSNAHLDHFISKPWDEKDLLLKLSA